VAGTPIRAARSVVSSDACTTGRLTELQLRLRGVPHNCDRPSSSGARDRRTPRQLRGSCAVKGCMRRQKHCTHLGAAKGSRRAALRGWKPEGSHWIQLSGGGRFEGPVRDGSARLSMPLGRLLDRRRETVPMPPPGPAPTPPPSPSSRPAWHAACRGPRGPGGGTCAPPPATAVPEVRQ